MKVCKKCNRSFPNDAVFCSECGEKLVDEIKCPRCGAEVEPEDRFCSKCGYNLKEGNKCSKCGAELKEGSKFCPACGEPLNKNQVIEPKRKHRNISSDGSLHPAINFVFIGLFFLVALLALIGFFGNIVTAKLLDYEESLTIKYFFGDRIDALEELAITYSTDEFYTFTLAFFVIHCITYFGGIVGLLTTIGFGIAKVVVSCKTRKIFSRKFFLYALFSVLPYLSVTAFMYVTSTNFAIKMSFGWGTSMLLVAGIISALSYAASYILDGKHEWRQIAVRALVSLSFICVVLISVFGVTSQILVKEAAAKMNAGIYAYFSESVEAFSAANKKEMIGEITIPDLLVISFAFGFATVVIALITLTTLTKANKAKIISGIICVSALLIASLLTGILGSTEIQKAYTEATKDYYGVTPVTVGLGSGVVFTMIFSILAIGSLITALSLYKEE